MLSCQNSTTIMVTSSDVNTPHQWYTIPPSWSLKWQCMWSLALRWIVIFFVRIINLFINFLVVFEERHIFHWQYLLDAKMQEPITNIPFWQKKEMMRKMKKKCCLWFSFINLNYRLQPMYLIGEEVQSEICKCILLMFGSCNKCTLIAYSS